MEFFLLGRQKYDSSSECLPRARIGVIIYLFELLNVWKDVIFPEFRESYPKEWVMISIVY